MAMQALPKALECDEMRAVELEVFLAHVNLELAHRGVTRLRTTSYVFSDDCESATVPGTGS